MGAERCSRIIAKQPLDSAVKAWFYKLTNSLQQTINNARVFPVLFSHRILTFVSNCRNLCSASPSLLKDGCKHTMKSVLRLAKRPNNLTPRIWAHEIHAKVHAKTQQNDSGINSYKNVQSFPLFSGLGKYFSCISQNSRQWSKGKRLRVSWESKWGLTPHISSPSSQ